jgi:tetraacyldisaccharide 4'-kinase
MPHQQSFFTTFEYDELKPFFDCNKPALTDKISAAAGIANPRLFEEYITKKYAKPQMLIFPDHHNFSKTDIKKICKIIDSSELFITTEKDAMRLMHYENFTQQQKAKMFYLPVKVKFLNITDENKLTDYLDDCIKIQ